MSLKARLRISIVTLVTMLVLMQCVATLRFTIEDKFNEVQDRAESIKQQTRLQVQQRVSDRMAAYKPQPVTFEETKAVIYRLVASDTFLPVVLRSSLIGSPTIGEIQVCDVDGVILTSSSQIQSTQTYVSLPRIEDWRRSSLWDQLREVLFNKTQDYVLVVPLGRPGGGEKERILDLRIVVSTALIRDAVGKQVKTLAGIFTLTLLAAMALAYFFSNVLLSWLNRITRRIESIATGNFTPLDKATTGKEPKEN